MVLVIDGLWVVPHVAVRLTTPSCTPLSELLEAPVFKAGVGEASTSAEEEAFSYSWPRCSASTSSKKAES